MKDYDLIIIGSGPAGFSSAIRALDFGLNICIVEGSHIGGAGIMNGALTSKTMYELSMDYSVAARTDRGYRSGSLSVDFKEVIKTVIHAAKEKQYQILSQIETFSEEKNGKGSLTLEKGWAKFIDTHTISITNKDSSKRLTAKNFIIATGAKPRKAPGLEIDHKRIINSEDILNLKKFPERMLIIGSGIIGCEFATIFSNFKQTEVHLLDRAKRVLPYEDNDVSEFVSKNLENNGVIIHQTANLRTIKKHPEHLEVILDYEAGNSMVIEVDVALVAIGRVANTDKLGLENAGLKTTERGTLEIADHCCIKETEHQPHIYAAGDVTGHTQLYSVAEFQGRLAAEQIADTPCYPLDYSHMSTLMFFKPELASVGLNEKQLRAHKVPHKVAYYSNKLVNRAIAMRNTNGFVKIIVSNDDQRKILGMRAGGPQASAYIVSVAHLINQGNSLQEVLKIFYPHPSLAEGIQECLRTLSGKSIYKPEAFPDLITFKEWNPEEPE
ncbi:dihydrolipoyl dehydrogenase family protein [Plebeiibacterium marinum]|uniref:NAD(P)/FAD-dependent oxidoreductase n=1 Tax=Plebeiibacterium marinum TaxID=2992111 RepID=A0AAE3MAD2_9BACT|nr:NAD(P)/FAD-dependent oxidoreductase [Plebeiobacterium marinum]MCW3804258.1 NAD(P)/FAD-dependent oxidoreductase [Plebeiobacterium marinum]